MRITIHRKNLPPSNNWLLWIWVMVVTVKVFDFDPGFYYAIGTLALLLLVGYISVLKDTHELDIFENHKKR